MAFNGRAHIGGNGTAGEWGHNPLPDRFLQPG
ncbi:ROK family protein [Escherichia sp. HC-CC]